VAIDPIEAVEARLVQEDEPSRDLRVSAGVDVLLAKVQVVVLLVPMAFKELDDFFDLALDSREGTNQAFVAIRKECSLGVQMKEEGTTTNKWLVVSAERSRKPL